MKEAIKLERVLKRFDDVARSRGTVIWGKVEQAKYFTKYFYMSMVETTQTVCSLKAQEIKNVSRWWTLLDPSQVLSFSPLKNLQEDGDHTD